MTEEMKTVSDEMKSIFKIPIDSRTKEQESRLLELSTKWNSLLKAHFNEKTQDSIKKLNELGFEVEEKTSDDDKEYFNVTRNGHFVCICFDFIDLGIVIDVTEALK